MPRVLAVFCAVLGFSSTASAAPCPTNLPHPLYGSGGSAVTATFAAVATALANLPEDDRITLFWSDPGACTGYHSFVDKDTGSGLATKPTYFLYWNAAGQVTKCDATGDEPLAFAHMGNTPALCPAKQPLPQGFGRFSGPIQTINLITHARSQYDAISAEAAYYVFGFGPGAAGKTVAPWTDPNAVFARPSNAFVQQVPALAFNIPVNGFKVPPANVLSKNELIVDGVFNWGEANDPNVPLGIVSGSAADVGRDQNRVKTLALQYFDQSCGYLPDSSRASKDKLNVRKGQYYLFTPGQFYAKVDSNGAISDPAVNKFVHWIDGTLAPPAGLDISKLIIQSGDIPLCAMQANRPDGDLNPIVSYAPTNPCNGYFEFTATGSTTHAACSESNACKGAGEKCRFGFCEAY